MTEELIQAIEKIMDEQLKPLKEDISSMKEDISSMKANMEEINRKLKCLNRIFAEWAEKDTKTKSSSQPDADV